MPEASSKLTSQTTKNYYMKTTSNESKDFELSNVSEDVSKKVLSLDSSKSFSKLSAGQCISIGSSLKKYNKFINKTYQISQKKVKLLS